MSASATIQYQNATMRRPDQSISLNVPQSRSLLRAGWNGRLSSTCHLFFLLQRGRLTVLWGWVGLFGVRVPHGSSWATGTGARKGRVALVDTVAPARPSLPTSRCRCCLSCCLSPLSARPPFNFGLQCRQDAALALIRALRVALANLTTFPLVGRKLPSCRRPS